MKNPDEAIDRVLTGLRETEAPQGMERRVLDAVEQRATQRKRSTFTSFAMAMGKRPWAVSVAGIAVVALAASLALHKRHEAPQNVAVLPNDPLVVAVPEHAIQVSETKTDRPSSRRVLAALPYRNVSIDKSEAVSDEDSLAVSEMLAPSKPAPPLPLTHQERLLAEVVHHGNPEGLASLRSDVRFKQMEIAKAEFHDFFEPLSVKRNE